MTSGSWRMRERRPVSRVKPAAGLTWDWATPGTATSIGSSRVARARLPCAVGGELAEAGVEGGGLAAAGGSGQDDGARGFLERADELGQ